MLKRLEHFVGELTEQQTELGKGACAHPDNVRTAGLNTPIGDQRSSTTLRNLHARSRMQAPGEAIG